MSVRITTDVFCDGCGNWCEGVTDGLHIRRNDAFKIAKAQGWKRIRRDNTVIDLCPRCYANQEIETAAKDSMIRQDEMDTRHVRMMNALGYEV